MFGCSDMFLIPLCISSEEISSDNNDVVRVARQLLNKSGSSRMLPRQECMFLLAGLNLTMCTEMFEKIGMNSFTKISEEDEKAPAGTVKQYGKRSWEHQDMCFHDWFYLTKNEHICKRQSSADPVHSKRAVVPVYVGVSDFTTIPVSKTYARSMLFIYEPWRPGTFVDEDFDYVGAFEKFVNGSSVHTSLLVSYNRNLMLNEQKNRVMNEPVAERMHINDDLLDESDDNILNLVGKHGEISEGHDFTMERGYTYDWSKRHVQV